MPFSKSGPLTQEELLLLWMSVTDREYNRPLLEKPNSGIEFITQSHAQLARTSESIDRTTQAMYILPWSGQTNEPATGERYATVILNFTRSGVGTVPANFPIVLTPDIFIEHAPDDYSAEGPIRVLTGRRYAPDAIYVIGPGVLGPVQVVALSEFAAAGYNLPQPGTIRQIYQPGSEYSNSGASVSPQAATNRLTLAPIAEVLTPAHIGQYVIFTAGSNTGRIRRMVGYNPPGPTDGGTAILGATATIQITGLVGTFTPGEVVEQASSQARANIIWNDAGFAVLEAIENTLITGQPITGLQSGAHATVSQIVDATALAAETSTAAWRVLGWETDFGLEVTNLESPSGGRTPMLDELGAERNIPRGVNEFDETYRLRVATPADVVSPNALIRSANRVLAPIGYAVCFREVGSRLLPGFFFDADIGTDPALAFAWDMDFDVRPEDRFKVWLDHIEMRAFFMAGVPRLNFGEFGFAYDESPFGGYETEPFNDFYDGFPAGNAAFYSATWQALDKARAGGASFDLYIEDLGCF